MKSIIDSFLKQGKDNVRKYHMKSEVGWTLVPIEDWREKSWQLHGETAGSTLLFSNKELTEELAEKGQLTGARVCTVTSISKKIYKTDRHTMIAVNDNAGWGKLVLFDNEKEVKTPRLEVK